MAAKLNGLFSLLNLTSMTNRGGDIYLVTDILKNPVSRQTFPEQLDIIRRVLDDREAISRPVLTVQAVGVSTLYSEIKG